MRRLTKLPKPDILIKKGTAWTSEYVAAHARGEAKKAERWADSGIRSVLKDETGSKCAYCDSRIGHVSYPHVEHMVPKSVRPELAHEWDNLTVACAVCNVEKGDYFSPTCPLLNPYSDDPREHVIHYGPFIGVLDPFGRGRVFVNELKLNRDELVLARTRRLEAIGDLLALWRMAPGEAKSALEKGLREDALNGEYSMMIVDYLVAQGFPLLPNEAL